jgi:serine/threonine-protein kinase RsbW
MEVRRIDLTIDSNPEKVPTIVNALNSICSLIPLSDAETYQIEVCVIEAVNNVIKHAYGNESGHEVDITLALYTNKIVLNICDFGRKIEQKDIPPLDFDPDSLKDFSESDMGLFIISSIMDEIEYTTSSGKNILTLTKHLKPERHRGVVTD